MESRDLIWVRSQIARQVLLPVALSFTFHFISGNHPFTLLRYYASDLFWAYALTAALLIIWSGELPIFWVGLLCTIYLGIEYGQYLGLIPGSGDMRDIGMYMFGTMLAYLCIEKEKKILL